MGRGDARMGAQVDRPGRLALNSNSCMTLSRCLVYSSDSKALGLAVLSSSINASTSCFN